MNRLTRAYCRLFGHQWRPLGWLVSDHGWICVRCRMKGRSLPGDYQ